MLLCARYSPKKMIEVYPNLFVGSQTDYETNPALFDNWYVVHACKEPYHRNALGYTGRGAPKGSPYYLFLYDEKHHLILNMVDTDDPRFFDNKMIDEAISYCIDGLNKGKQVLIHCNQGESRAPSLAILVLRKIGYYKGTFDESLADFKKKCPLFNPKRGIFEYIKSNY